MKWLILQSNGQNPENQLFKECFAVQSALINLGCKAEIWGPGHESYQEQPDFNIYDIILCIEDYDSEWIPDYSKSRAIKLYLVIDLHIRLPKCYDKVVAWSNIILHATMRLIDGFSHRHPRKKHIWFPNAVDSRFFNGSMIDSEKVDDVLFVGNILANRQPLLDEIKKHINMRQVRVLGPEMIKVISQTKINFNRNICGDINYRTFETIGIGTCLITDYDQDLIALGFEDGINCLMYRDVNEAVTKIRCSLESGSWDSIARAGFELSSNHTYEVRYQKLIDIIVDYRRPYLKKYA